MLQKIFKIPMRKLIFVILISICLGITFSCDTLMKDRIEIKFQDYVSNNVDNPKDLVEVVSIEKTDSFDILQHINGCINDVSLDSLRNGKIKYMEKLIYLAPKLPDNIRAEIGEKVLPIILEYKNQVYSDVASYNLKKKELSLLYEGIDSTKAVQRSYLIKARIRHNGDVVMKEFYAMDCCIIDSVVISDTPIQTENLPSQVSEALTVLNEFWAIIKKEMKFIKILQNTINECELYIN